MEWTHKCDLDWLKERQKYITASEIKKLLPVTATGRKRTVTDLDRIKVMSGKMVTLTDKDCWSFGAMARGHILEPYAIDALNAVIYETGEEFHWWDDKIISLPNRKLAFSPDAMDVPMDDEDAAKNVTAIAEVKSYTADKHLVIAYTPKNLIEERWQIASAMALLDNIDHAYLVLFNPRMKRRRTFVIRYDRSELESEIETVRDVEEEWTKFLVSGPLTSASPNGAVWSALGGSEEQIVEREEARQRLNPI